MNLSIPKLRHLWQNRSILQHDETLIDSRRRVTEILAIAAEWEAERSITAALNVGQSAEDADIPKGSNEGGWAAVKRDQLKFYQSHDQLKDHTAHVEQVSQMLHVSRECAEYCVSSIAPAEKPHETLATKGANVAPNPASHLASHNHPFEVIQFYLACDGLKTPTSSPIALPTSRFPYKFLWMVANRSRCLPVFSLQSMQSLSGTLHELKPDQRWSEILSGRWNLSLKDFADRWPDASNALCRAITDHDYGSLPDDQTRQQFQQFVFLVSLHSTTTKNAFDMLRTGNQALILYGPPGTGKTFQAMKVARQMFGMHEDLEEDLEALQFGKKPDLAAGGKGCWELVQFHASYSYQDFMGGILPSLDPEDGRLSYKLNEGTFMSFCKVAGAHRKKPFVFIIDEINRADLSAVFGELMYALEYRDKEVQVTHFGGFKIPENVFIIGTMNTTDKSLTSFDLALRRRFTFFKLPPDLECLMDWGTRQDFCPEQMKHLIDRAKKLNAYLTDTHEGLSLAADYAVGQAYFMKVKDFCPPDEGRRNLTAFALEQLWNYHLEPLIEEYLGADAANRQSSLQTQRQEFIKPVPNMPSA